MPRAPKKFVVTAARVELYLDKLAEIMDRIGPRAHLCIPLWKRLEAEHARLVEEEAILAAARERAKRSKERTATRSD